MKRDTFSLKETTKNPWKENTVPFKETTKFSRDSRVFSLSRGDLRVKMQKSKKGQHFRPFSCLGGSSQVDSHVLKFQALGRKTSPTPLSFSETQKKLRPFFIWRTPHTSVCRPPRRQTEVCGVRQIVNSCTTSCGVASAVLFNLQMQKSKRPPPLKLQLILARLSPEAFAWKANRAIAQLTNCTTCGTLQQKTQTTQNKTQQKHNKNTTKTKHNENLSFSNFIDYNFLLKFSFLQNL